MRKKAQFVPAPGWPPLEAGTTDVPPGWTADADMPPIPRGWQLFRPVGAMSPDQQRIQKAEEARREAAIAGGVEPPLGAQEETSLQRYLRDKAAKAADERAARERRNKGQMSKPIGGTVRSNLSEVGDRSSGLLACPKCGGAQFRIKRRGLVKGAAWLAAPVTGALSLAALAAPKSRVQCLTCKTEYLRG